MSTFAWSWNLPTNVACGRSTSRCRGVQHKLRYVEMIADDRTKSLTFYITVYTYICLIDYFLLYVMHWDLELHILPRTLHFTASLLQIIFASLYFNCTCGFLLKKVIFRFMLTTIFGKIRVEVCLMQLILRIVTQMMCWSLFSSFLRNWDNWTQIPLCMGLSCNSLWSLTMRSILIWWLTRLLLTRMSMGELTTLQFLYFPFLVIFDVFVFTFFHPFFSLDISSWNLA